MAWSASAGEAGRGAPRSSSSASSSISLQIPEHLVRLFLIDPAEGEADVDDDVIANLGLGHVGEAGFLEDAAEIDFAHARSAGRRR